MNPGFMQGRLCPQVQGKIQAFPAAHWREEFSLAESLDFDHMEWTIDHEGLQENPLMTIAGRAQIRELCGKHGVSIPSVTGDCFMQAPFWKTGDPGARAALIWEFDAVLHACAAAGIGLVVVPLVDNGSIRQTAEANALHESLLERTGALERLNVKIAFETDLDPVALGLWIADFPSNVFGVNYDTGNSAALGYDPATEWALYGDRVFNVHLKDRPRGGTTVPLGEGDCDFPACFCAMRKAGYKGNFILQTARAADGNHAGALARYRDFVVQAWRVSEEPGK